MDSTDMEIFLTVARTGSVSTAAHALYITQSTLSKRIKQIEEELQVVLFFRGKGQKKVEITAAGLAFMELAQAWQGIWQDMRNLRNLEAYPTLNVGVLDSVETLTVSLVRELHNRDPEMMLRILVRPSSTMYDEIDKRVIDVGFSHLDRQMPSVRKRRLFEEPFVAVCSGAHESGKRETLSPGDLDPDREVFVRWWSPGYLVWHENFWDLRRSQHLSTNSVNLQKIFLEVPGRWGIMPYSLARNLCGNPMFFMYRLDPSPPPRVCTLLTHRQPRSGAKKALDLFYEYLGIILRVEMPWTTLQI